MPDMDAENTRELVQHFRTEAASYRRQWTLSLGIGCGGAAIALTSLAANLPDPDFAFRLFAPSLWLFLLGIAAAAASLPMAARRSESLGEHYASSFNRGQLQAATRRLPEYVSAPRSLAEEMNAPRNELIREGNEAHDRAEKAWRERDQWHWALRATLAISVAAFILGVSLPLVHISRGGVLVPAKAQPAPVVMPLPVGSAKGKE